MILAQAGGQHHYSVTTGGGGIMCYELEITWQIPSVSCMQLHSIVHIHFMNVQRFVLRELTSEMDTILSPGYETLLSQ